MASNAKFSYHFWEPHLLNNFANSPIKFASTLDNKIPKGLSGKLIGEDYLVCVMSDSHPLKNKMPLSIEDILKYQHIVITGVEIKTPNLMLIYQN